MKWRPSIRGSSTCRTGFTLAEVMVSMAIVLLAMAAILSCHLFGLRMFEITKAKLGASDDARGSISRMIGEIRSAKLIRIGQGNASSFTEVALNTPQSGTWTSPDYTSVLRLQIRFQGSGQSNQLRPEELRQVVLQELPAARITEEFSCPSGSAPGLAFDAERRMASEVSVLSRMAFLPVPGGRAEVLLSTPRERFAQRQAEFTGFLNSFQVQSR
jgi:prepilin-type N-terminal cleavage/methylation domain-containing protein